MRALTASFGPVPLTPTAFLARANAVFGDRVAFVGDGTRRTYATLFERCTRQAGALVHLGVVPGSTVTERELIEHVKSRIARFKAPRRVVFDPLPKTATGKIKKFVLRDREWAGNDRRIG